jgi:hypothetical protein
MDDHMRIKDFGQFPKLYAEALYPELFTTQLNDVTPEQWDETYAKLNPMKSTTNSEPDLDSLPIEEQQEYRDWSDSVDVQGTLDARGKRYGEFQAHASITQQLKFLMHSTDNWEELTPSMKESLEMIAHKIGRILNGDPAYADSWHDIAGYATLVDKELQGEIV